MVTFDVMSGYFFTGLGVATGSAFVELYIKPHMVRWKKKSRELKERLGRMWK